MRHLLCLLGGFFLIIRAAADDLVATFQPGKLGIGADWARGRVTRVDKGGQGERNGVLVDMIIKKVDGKNYHESLLDKRIAGKQDFELIFQRPVAPPPAPPKKEKDAGTPPKPVFKYATELNTATFKELVYKVTNGTDADSRPPYYPIVMFHMSWCDHCKHTLPEFENAAKTVEEKRKYGKLKYEAFPKLFVFECDNPPEHKALCDMYATGSYPIIKVFRDKRSVRFNRPRVASTLAWWALHVARPPMFGIDDGELFDSAYAKRVWVLHADVKKHHDILSDWKEVALDNLEDHTFVVAQPGSKVSKDLEPAPSVTVKGEGLEPLPLEGAITRQSLSDWVNFNQFAPVAELSPYSEQALKGSGFVVIALVYRSGDEESNAALGHFKFKAKQLRKHRQFLFAAIDVSKEENADYLGHSFRLMHPALAPLPRIFAFEGKDIYWESPSMRNPSELTMESIGAFLAESEARQDKSTSSWIKEKKKIVWRVSTGSVSGMITAVVVVGMFLAFQIFCFIPCIKAIFMSDDEGYDKKD